MEKVISWTSCCQFYPVRYIMYLHSPYPHFSNFIKKLTFPENTQTWQICIDVLIRLQFELDNIYIYQQGKFSSTMATTLIKQNRKSVSQVQHLHTHSSTTSPGLQPVLTPICTPVSTHHQTSFYSIISHGLNLQYQFPSFVPGRTICSQSCFCSLVFPTFAYFPSVCIWNPACHLVHLTECELVYSY